MNCHLPQASIRPFQCIHLGMSPINDKKVDQAIKDIQYHTSILNHNLFSLTIQKMKWRFQTYKPCIQTTFSVVNTEFKKERYRNQNAKGLGSVHPLPVKWVPGVDSQFLVSFKAFCYTYSSKICMLHKQQHLIFNCNQTANSM